jgi:hypothetical protein
METRFCTCRKCGESDYLDYTATIDGIRYCQGCYDEYFDKMEADLIEEVFKPKTGVN